MQQHSVAVPIFSPLVSVDQADNSPPQKAGSQDVL